MDSLMTVFLSDGFADQGSQLALGNVAFVKYHAADNDPIDGIHLGQAAVDLLLKDTIGNIVLHAVGVSYLFADAFQRFHGDGITAAPVRTICAVAHTNMSRGCIAFTGSLETLALLPEWTHDVAEFFMGQRCPRRIAGQVVGLLSTGVSLV